MNRKENHPKEKQISPQKFKMKMTQNKEESDMKEKLRSKLFQRLQRSVTTGTGKTAHTVSLNHLQPQEKRPLNLKQQQKLLNYTAKKEKPPSYHEARRSKENTPRIKHEHQSKNAESCVGTKRQQTKETAKDTKQSPHLQKDQRKSQLSKANDTAVSLSNALKHLLRNHRTKPLIIKPDMRQDSTSWRYEHKMSSQDRDHLDLGPTPDSPMMPGSNVNLFCPLCHEMYANPRLLPCLHTFCKRCLDNMVPPRSHNLTCPSCRSDIPLGDRGTNGFPPNFVVTTMIDVAALRNHDQKPILCSSCEDKLPAAARCIECMDFLCYDCRNAHMRLRLTKSHRVVSIEELRSNPHPEDLLHRPICCSDHGQEKLRYYCETCEQAICRECTMTTHSTGNHKYTQLTDTIDKQTSSITQLVDKLRRKIPVVEQSTKDVEEVTCRLEARAEVAKSEVQKCFPRILKILQEREKGMMNEVETIVRKKSSVLSLQQERLENELKKLTITCTFTEQVLRHGNSVEILVVKKQLCERLNELITTKFQGDPEENDTIYFVANQDEVIRAIETLGSIKTSQAFPNMCSVTDGQTRAIKGRNTKFNVQTRDHMGNPCTGGGEDVMVDVYAADGRTVPAEVDDHRNGSYGISYTPQSSGMHKVKDREVSVTVRDKHIQGSPFKVNVTSGPDTFVKFGRKGSDIGEFNGIFGVAVDDESRIIVTDCHNHRVQVFNSQGGFMFQFGRKGEGNGQFQCPTGVGIDPEGRIVVCERLSSRIQLFDRDGMFQHKFHVPDLKASTLAVDENRRIVVADSANRCIHVISLDTGQSFKFGSFGDSNGELSYPCYVAVNPQGHIIVSDMHSHRIQIFDSRGRFLFNFGRKGSQDGELLRPTGVAVTQNGNIIVADRDNHRIQIFSSDGRFISKFGSKGDGEGQLNDPHGLALTPEGNICVADFRNNRVQIIPIR